VGAVTTWTDGNVTIKLDLTELEEMVKEMPERAEEVVKKVALRAEGHMKQRAAVDTGAMKNSIYTVTNKYSRFPGVQLMGKTLTPHPNPPPMTAYVGPSVDYAIYVEFGTHKITAQPFVIPGLEQAAKDLPAIAPELFK